MERCATTEKIQHPNIPAFQHSSIPTFQHSNIPAFQHSSTPTLQYPILHHSTIPIRPMETHVSPPSASAERQTVEQILAGHTRIQRELAKVIVGQKAVIEQLLIALFAGGHCLITGAPGLAKTLLVKSLARIFHLKFQRIQFTPDLMPADITGVEILQEST